MHLYLVTYWHYLKTITQAKCQAGVYHLQRNKRHSVEHRSDRTVWFTSNLNSKRTYNLVTIARMLSNRSLIQVQKRHILNTIGLLYLLALSNMALYISLYQMVGKNVLCWVHLDYRNLEHSSERKASHQTDQIHNWTNQWTFQQVSPKEHRQV